MDRFFYIAARKYGLYKLPISALSLLVHECHSGGIHMRRFYMTCRAILLTFLQATHERASCDFPQSAI